MENRHSAPAHSDHVVPARKTNPKVVIRYLDGRLRQGYLVNEEEGVLQPGGHYPIVVETPEGNHVEVQTSEIKALFFVKRFEGNRDYSEFTVFSNRPSGRGVWVRVKFLDGEVMEGVAPNRLDTYFGPAFSMTPPDPASNNVAVWVSKHSLKEMHVLGVASD